MSAIDTEHESEGYALEAGDGSDVPNAFLRLCRRLTLALDVWECCIYEYLPDRDCLLAQAIWSHKLEERDREWIGSENHLNRHPDIARVFAERAIVVTQADDDAATAEKERMEYWGEQTALFAPIVLDGEVLGIIELTEHRRHREFSSTDLRLVEALADVAAVAVDNARSSGRQRIINARLNALLDTSRAISSTVVLDEVLQMVAERVAEALHAPRATSTSTTRRTTPSPGAPSTRTILRAGTPTPRALPTRWTTTPGIEPCSRVARCARAS